MSVRNFVSPAHPGALTALREDGVFRVPDHLSPGEVAVLREEFEFIFSRNQAGVRPIDYSLGRGAVCQPEKLEQAQYPALLAVFLADVFRKLASAYLASPFELNRDVFAVEDVVGSRHHANDLHYDVLRTLKFYVYLNDVDMKNGAFTCVPGSHHETARLRTVHGSAITLDNREVTRRLPLEKFAAPEPVVGTAGTLIVFDTDVWHQAGTVRTGHRLVMRGHTRTTQPVTARDGEGLGQTQAPRRGLLRWLRRQFG